MGGGRSRGDACLAGGSRRGAGGSACLALRSFALPRLGGGRAHRRQPHRITEHEPGVDLGTLAVHPDLTLAHDAVQTGPRQPGVLAGQEPVKATAGMVFSDQGVCYGSFLSHFRNILFFKSLCHKLPRSPSLPPHAVYPGANRREVRRWRASHVSWSSAMRPSNPADSGRVRRRVLKTPRRAVGAQTKAGSVPRFASSRAGRTNKHSNNKMIAIHSFAPFCAALALTALSPSAPSRIGAPHEKNACKRDAAGRTARRPG